MKKVVSFSILFLILFASFTYFFKDDLKINSQSAVLMDAMTGDIFYKKDATKGYPVASISKLMTEYVVLDKITSGVISWDDPVIMSNQANSVGTNAVVVAVNVGETLTVRDLFKAMVISSANNAAIALAEHISGTEEAFTQLMNEKARTIGLSNQTKFVNATGLPAEQLDGVENLMSATDVATLVFQLLKDYESDVIEIASKQYDQIADGKIDIYTTNKMLNSNSQWYFAGLDGLKTGFTNAAGYNFASTAMKNNNRLICVVMNASDEEMRFSDTKKLLSFGF